MARNVAASTRQRLLNLSKSTGTDHNQLLIRYAIERLLYRLGRSTHAEAFILKGAMLFGLWEGSPHRPTQDVDLLGFGDRSLARVLSVFRDLCVLAVEEDGWTFDPATVEAHEIRTMDEYGGVRVHLTGALGGARIRVQVDVGFGDAVTPPASVADYPSLLGFPAPHLRVYPRETVVAEKVEAIVKLGTLNTRYKDYFDLRHLAQHFEFDGTLLIAAMSATFARRGRPLPTEVPIGLSALFGNDAAKQSQWAAFGRRLSAQPLPSLAQVVAEVAAFVLPPLTAAARSAPFTSRWTPSGSWSPAS